MTWEIRFYIWVFIAMCIAITFGVLRLYNAVVKNSGFLVRLYTEIKNLESSIKNLTKDNGVHRNTLRNAITSLGQKLDSLKDKIKDGTSKNS